MKSFREKVLLLAKNVPRGKVITYGEIAGILKTSPRAVGGALHKNPRLIKIPCHRVVMSDGRLGGYAGGADKKMKLLQKEGVKIKNGKIIDLRKIIYEIKK